MALGPNLNKPKAYDRTTGFTFGGGPKPPPMPSGVKIEHRIGVQAPAETIWEVIADLPAWAEWNPLYPKAEGQIRIGGQLELTLALEGDPPRVIRPTVIDWVPNDQLHWKLKAVGGLVSTVRYLEIEQLDVASCIFSNGEIIGGLLGPNVAKRMGRRIWRGFEAMGQALKVRAEARWREQGAAPTSAP